jgi:hypothetical protein
MVMAERRIGYLWATAAFKHQYLQLQFFVMTNLNDTADPTLDFFRGKLLLAIALGVVDCAIITHKDWTILKRLDSP